MATKTIQIFLKDAEKDGIKIADLSNRVARVYVVPRAKLSFVNSRPELAGPALYMLFDEERTTVYLGECENVQARIAQHQASKDFWSTVVICLTADGGLDKADVKFLESFAVQKAVEIGRFNVQNRTAPALNNLKEFKREANLELFEDFELLLTTLGYDLFEPLEEVSGEPTPARAKPTAREDEREFDTIICPSTGDGPEEAFRKKSAWWAVRIGRANIPKLKYVGLYEAAPVSAIRYYAKIVKIEPHADNPAKYIIHHDGNINELTNHVILGDNPELSLYGPRYFKLDDIRNSKTMAELTDRAFGSDYVKSTHAV